MVNAETMEPPLTAPSVSRQDTFARLMEQYTPAIRRLAGAYLRNQVDREDLVQEIAVAIWRAIPAFRKASSERTWLYRIAHNVAISSSAKLRRHSRLESPLDNDFDPASKLPDAEHELEAGQRRRWLIESIRSLPALDRQIVVLHLENLSYAEIEQVTGLSETAIAARLTRIRTRLKEQIRTGEAHRHER